MSNASVMHVTATPAYAHPTNPADEVKVAYTAPLPTVTAMSRTQVSMDKLGIDATKIEVEEELKSYNLEVTAENYIDSFKNCKDFSSMEQLRKRVNEEEHMLRRVYAKKAALADKPILKEKYPLLVPVFGNEDIFDCVALSKEEKNIPKAFPLEGKRKSAGTRSIVDRAGFATNWRIFSENLLTLVNWDNVFVAGGAVLACLLPPPPKATKNYKCLRKYFHEDVYAGSDIDLFLYGLNEEEGKKKLNEIYEAVCNEIPYTALAFRSAYAISIVSQFPYRHIQIVLRLYSSPAEILMGFDVDSCSCGFDGKQVYMTPRCHQALIRQMNTVDMTRRSPTYELRLAKYADRGFEVEVPMLQREKIDPMIFEKPWDEVRGLAKLLLLEKLRTPEARYAYRQRTAGPNAVHSYKVESMMRDPYLKKRLEFSPEKASDYSTVFLPWGPSWNAKRIRKLMMTKDIVLNSDWSEIYNNRGYHTHPCFVGSLEEVIQDCCGECPEVPASVDPETLECFVRGPLSFIVDDPGRQSIGSFHPITEGDWTDGAYLSKDSEKLTAAANCGDLETIKSIVPNLCKVDTPDALGRTALHLAVLSNQVEAAKLLLDLGADATLHLKDGRSVLHIAAEYGYIEMLALLFEKLKLAKKGESNSEESGEGMDLDEVNKNTQLSALHYAVLFGHVDCAEFLLQNGATCDRMIWSADHNVAVSVILLAAHCEYFSKQVSVDLYELLHRYGASLKLLDSGFNNVMHQLANYNYIHFMEYILKHDPIAKSLCDEVNASCVTPACLAMYNGYYTMAKLMIEMGLPLRPSESAVTLTNNRRRKDRNATRWGFSPLDASNVAPPLIMVVNNSNVDTEASFNFLKFLVEHGEDVNEVWNNTTVLDAILSKEPFKSVEEMKEDMKNSNLSNKLQIDLLEKELKKYKPDSYDYLMLKETLDLTKLNSKANRRLTTWKLTEMKMRSEWPKKAYEMIDNHGGMMFLELKTLNPDLVGTRKSNRRQNRMFGSPFGEAPTLSKCVTVKGKTVLRGMKRIEALREQRVKDQEKNLKQMRIQNSGEPTVRGINQFTIYSEASSYGYRNNGNASEAEAEAYHNLFLAVYSSDYDTVRHLCTPDSKGHCTFVLCCGLNRSPLSIAVNKGDAEMIKLLFELMAMQYTPITIHRELNQTGKVSNYALVRGDYEDEEAFVDPNADHSLIVNTCDVDINFLEKYDFDMTGVKEYVTSRKQDQPNRYGYDNNWQYADSDFDSDSDSDSDSEMDVEDSSDASRTKSHEKDHTENCHILQYLIYRNDMELMKLFLDCMKQLGDTVFEKDLKANKVKQEDHKTKWLLNALYGIDVSTNSYYYSYRTTYVDIIKPLIMNDNVPLIRLLLHYTFLGLNVLRAKDVEPKKDVVKRRLVNHYDDDSDFSDYSYSDDYEDEDEEKKEELKKAMEEENDKELNEEGKVEEEEESEYADSDEEEMKALRQFKQEGKAEVDEKRSNAMHPILIALRYASEKALSYFLDPARMKEDLEILKQSNEDYAKYFEEADGIDAVYERVFSLKYLKNDYRLLLEAAAMTDDEKIFKKLMETLKSQGLDIDKLIHRSKFYPSLLEFSLMHRCYVVGQYLLKTFSFREKEVTEAFCSLSQNVTNLHVDITSVNVGHKLTVRMGWSSRGSTINDNGMMASLYIYKNFMQLIQLIPKEFKDKVFDKMMSQVLTVNRPALIEKLAKEIPVKLEQFDDILKSVIGSNNDTALRLLIDCMGLKEKLMKENPNGYTIVELVMTKYIEDIIKNQRNNKKEREDEEERKEHMKLLEDEFMKVTQTQELVELYRLLKNGTGSSAKMLQLVLEASNGQQRELTTLEEVQDRVKRDSTDIAENEFGKRRRCLGRMGNFTVNYANNGRINMLCNMPKGELKKQ